MVSDILNVFHWHPNPAMGERRWLFSGFAQVQTQDGGFGVKSVSLFATGATDAYRDLGTPLRGV